MYTKKKKAIKISTDLLASIIHFLEDLDIDYFDPDTIQLYGYLLHSFKLKKLDFEFDALSRMCTNDKCNSMKPDDDYCFEDF
jgi:hypothetical protein